MGKKTFYVLSRRVILSSHKNTEDGKLEVSKTNPI